MLEQEQMPKIPTKAKNSRFALSRNEKKQMQTIQYRTSRIWEIKNLNIQKVLPKIRSVLYSNARYLEKRLT